MNPTLLIVDDEKTQREGLRAALEHRYDVYLAEDAKTATDLLERENFDVLLTDFRLPSEDGMKLIARAKSLAKPPVCILMTAYGSEELAVEAMKRGADDYIAKGRLQIDEPVAPLRRPREDLVQERGVDLVGVDEEDLRDLASERLAREPLEEREHRLDQRDPQVRPDLAAREPVPQSRQDLERLAEEERRLLGAERACRVLDDDVSQKVDAAVALPGEKLFAAGLYGDPARLPRRAPRGRRRRRDAPSPRAAPIPAGRRWPPRDSRSRSPRR